MNFQLVIERQGKRHSLLCVLSVQHNQQRYMSVDYFVMKSHLQEVRVRQTKLVREEREEERKSHRIAFIAD